MNLLLVKELSDKRGIPLKKIAELAGMSEQNFHRCLRINKIDAEILWKVSEILGVSITIFFEGKLSQLNFLTNKSDSDKIKHLEEQIATKEGEIKTLRETIQDKNDIIALLKERDAQTAGNATCADAAGA